jgi:hypothetical protein
MIDLLRPTGKPGTAVQRMCARNRQLLAVERNEGRELYSGRLVRLDRHF